LAASLAVTGILSVGFVSPVAWADEIGPDLEGEVSLVSGEALDNGGTVFADEGSTLTVLPPSELQPSEAQLAGLAAAITCSLNVEYVHASGHVSGTINGVATVKCTAAAGSLKLHYSLIRVSPNNKQWGAGSVSNVASRSIQNNRAVPCSEGPGNFQGWAQGEISPPPGYTLDGPATRSSYGSTLGVACGSTLSADSPLGVAESLAVTFVRSDLAN
jgi:hypothetical protein